MRVPAFEAVYGVDFSGAKQAGRCIWIARAEPRAHQVARYFEQRIAEEKDSGSQAIDRRTEPEVAVHVDRGKADIDAIEVRDDVEQEKKGDQAPAHLA